MLINAVHVVKFYIRSSLFFVDFLAFLLLCNVYLLQDVDE